MKKPDRSNGIRGLAAEAIDERGVAEILERVAEDGVDDGAAESLHRITTDVSAAIAAKAAFDSRYRATPIRGDDIADAWKELCGCECEEPPTTEWIARISVWETY